MPSLVRGLAPVLTWDRTGPERIMRHLRGVRFPHHAPMSIMTRPARVAGESRAVATPTHTAPWPIGQGAVSVRVT